MLDELTVMIPVLFALLAAVGLPLAGMLSERAAVRPARTR